MPNLPREKRGKTTSRERDLHAFRQLVAGWQDAKRRERRLADRVSGDVLRLRGLYGITWRRLASITGDAYPQRLQSRVAYYRDRKTITHHADR